MFQHDCLDILILIDSLPATGCELSHDTLKLLPVQVEPFLQQFLHLLAYFNVFFAAIPPF